MKCPRCPGPGVVGAGPAGLALTAAGDSAYKELCSVANEVGQPDLIYRFLALSSHHSRWHSRSGSGLAFEALLRSNARKEVEAHLVDLIPRLYRYQYDPMPRVQESMSRLWNVLVRRVALAGASSIGGEWGCCFVALLALRVSVAAVVSSSRFGGGKGCRAWSLHGVGG